MADKFRQTFPIAVSFSEGELPTASKLTGLATQARSGQGLLQYAVGDLWSQGGDSLLGNTTDMSSNALMIPNLARYLGAIKHASPAIPALPNIEAYSFKFTGYSGTREVRLPFPLASGAADPTWSSVGGEPTTKVASRGAVDAAGKYYIDDSGNVFTYDSINANWIMTYEPDVPGTVGSDTTWNVIPEPPVDGAYGFLGLKIQYKNSLDNSAGYWIYLPPRMPRYLSGSSSRPAWYPDAITQNLSTSPAAEKLFWQSNAVGAEDGANAEHYRYTLPTSLTGSSAWAANVSLPAGLLYLWDEYSTGTIIEGVTFQALGTPTKWGMFVPAGTPLDDWLLTSYGKTQYPTARLQSSLHTFEYYPNGGLKLITVGSDISQLIASLMNQFLSHDHASANSPVSRPVPHGTLAGLFNPAGFTPQLDASKLTNDDHPQYLHRKGYGTDRDKFGNGLLGDLLINATGGTNYLSNSSVSNKLVFGSSTGGYLRQSAAAALDVISRVDLNLNSKTMGQGGSINLTSDNNLVGAIDNYVDLYTIGAGNPAEALTTGDVALRANADVKIKGDVKVWIDTGTLDINAALDLDGSSASITTTGDILLDSVDDVLIRGDRGVDIRAGESAPGGVAGNNDLVISAQDQLWLYSNNETYLNQNPIFNATKSAYLEFGINNWHSNDTANARAVIWPSSLQHWQFGPAGDVFYTWTFINGIPHGAYIDRIKFWLWIDSRDEVSFTAYRSDYGNNHTSIGYDFVSGTDNWVTATVECGGERIWSYQTLGIKFRHSDDNYPEGGPDAYVYMHSVCRVEMRCNRISGRVNA